MHAVVWVWKSGGTFQDSVLAFDLVRAGSLVPAGGSCPRDFWPMCTTASTSGF